MSTDTMSTDAETRQTAETGGQKGVKITRYDLIPLDVLPIIEVHRSDKLSPIFDIGNAALDDFWARRCSATSIRTTEAHPRTKSPASPTRTEPAHREAITRRNRRCR